MSHQSFDDPAQDVFLPQIRQDESLESVLQGLDDTTFPSFQGHTLENFNILSPEPLPFTTSDLSSTTISTPPLSNSSRDFSVDVTLPQQAFSSEPSTPQPYPSNHYPPHSNSDEVRHPQPRSHHLYYNIGVPQQPGSFNPPPHILHQRSHSQPPEQVTFFRAPHQSSRNKNHTLTGGIPLSNTPGPILPYANNSNQGMVIPKPTPRYRDHPYRSSSRSRRDGGPTSAPPQRMMSSPRPISSRGVRSPGMHEVMHQGDSPMFVRMQTPEENPMSAAQSPRAIEVGAARVTSALGDALLNASGTVSSDEVAVVLRFVDDVERKHRETLAGCEKIKHLFARPKVGDMGEEADADVEPLQLDQTNGMSDEARQQDSIADGFPKQESLQDADMKLG